MGLQCRCVIKQLFTLKASEALVLVFVEMGLVLPLRVESFLTGLAEEWIVSGVRGQVSLQPSRTAKQFTTVFARETRTCQK